MGILRAWWRIETDSQGDCVVEGVFSAFKAVMNMHAQIESAQSYDSADVEDVTRLAGDAEVLEDVCVVEAAFRLFKAAIDKLTYLRLAPTLGIADVEDGRNR